MAAHNAGGSRLPAPVARDGGWAVIGGSANRLWERGCFGKPTNGGVVLTNTEVLNAHRLRGLPLPNPKWLEEIVEVQGDIFFECEVLDALRYPGEKVILKQNLSAVSAVVLDPKTWALRWSRSVQPKYDDPISEIRWFHASDTIDWKEILQWTSNVESGGRIAELLIVDDEHGVVTYRTSLHQPTGKFRNPFTEMENDERRLISKAWSLSKPTDNGYWIPSENMTWPLEGMGIELENGIWISNVEARIVSRVVNPTMPKPDGELGKLVAALSDLISRGLAIRSGFKYGTRWRGYSGAVGEDHAPWLIVPLDEAPLDWGEACLVARLAAGVNKNWLCAIPPQEIGGWRYLALERPPSDSRWANPKRH